MIIAIVFLVFAAVAGFGGYHLTPPEWHAALWLASCLLSVIGGGSLMAAFIFNHIDQIPRYPSQERSKS